MELGKLGVHDLLKIRGIGKVKAIVILAALELGRRRHSMTPLDKPAAARQPGGGQLPADHAAGLHPGGICRLIPEPGQPGKPF